MSTPFPPMNWLRVFEAAARYESFARAAEDLGMSAAAVSQQIRALEDRLGTPLFDRHAHAVTLTQMGRAYLPAVQQALVSLQEATDGLFGTISRQSVFVQAVPLFAHGILARGCAVFAAQFPDVSLTLITEPGGLDYASRYHDLRIVFEAPGPGVGGATALLEETLFPVATPEIAAQVGEPADILNFPLIDVAAHRAGWPYVFEKLGFARRAARYIHTDNSLVGCAVAAEGAGIALARAPASDRAVDMAGLVPCLDGFQIKGANSYHLVVPGPQTLRRPVRQFRDWLVAYCRTL